MRKKIATIGVVIIMVGVALSLTGFITIDKAPVNDAVCTGSLSGEYTSKIIDYSGGDILVIAGSSGTAGLIKYNEYPNATSGNLPSMAVKYTKESSSGFEYKNLPTGRYIYVMFTSAKPSDFGYSLESSAEFADLGYASYAFEIGIISFLAGIGVVIAGFILKPKEVSMIKPILKKK
ncbi:hypothetical protein [Ferroplasma sp.]|uniref:hypothetical protein n=1 Tax=Ferroplasma sp. TaxID=2591003 RepID=UPI002639AF1D|nr:hypothetical protein [Ferroplasma sp.]